LITNSKEVVTLILLSVLPSNLFQNVLLDNRCHSKSETENATKKIENGSNKLKTQTLAITTLTKKMKLRRLQLEPKEVTLEFKNRKLRPHKEISIQSQLMMSNKIMKR
jgi:hypothetical protein